MQKILPIDEIISRLMALLQEKNQIILKAPTGAGKSTFLPLRLLDAISSGTLPIKGQILLLEPRRIAAKNIAYFIAKQLGESPGQTIGYRMRGDVKVSAATKLLIVTEGVLTRMLQEDPELGDIGLIIFDEFHERSIHADTGLAFSLDVQSALRDDLKILLMSATLDESDFKKLMPDADYIESAGRSYAIDIHYDSVTNRKNRYEDMGRKILYWLSQEEGSALFFLPGQKEIRFLTAYLKERLLPDVELHSLYGRQSIKEQEAAIMPAPDGMRKLVLTTNVAETSLTIEGIRIVFDSGLERIANWDPKSRITELETKQISKSSAIQRAGRAGRVQEGVCIRFYTKENFEFMQHYGKPEILHTDLTDLALELVQWGVTDVSELMWLDQPNTACLESAYDLLHLLGITDNRKNLTPFGKKQAHLGVSPRLGAMLQKAREWSESPEICGILSMATLSAAIIEQHLSDRSLDMGFLLESVAAKRHPQAFLLLKRAKVLFSRLSSASFVLKIDHRMLGILCAVAYPDRIGLKKEEVKPSADRYKFSLSNGQLVTLDEKSAIAQAPSIVALDIMRAEKGAQSVFLAVQVDLSFLNTYMPNLFKWENTAYWDETKSAIVGEKRFICGDLVIKTRANHELSPEVIEEALLGAIRQKGLEVLPWNEKSLSLWQRYQWICGEFETFCTSEAMDNTYLLAHIAEWLSPFLTGIKSIKALQKIHLYDALEAWIGWDKVKNLNDLAPVYYEVPTGSQIRLRYEKGKAPVLSVRMQEMYGQEETPKIAHGQCALVVELLSPAQRPLQVTQDLASFWQHGYKEVQKEMKGRYPKHIWPDDPAHHQATKKTKKYFK